MRINLLKKMVLVVVAFISLFAFSGCDDIYIIQPDTNSITVDTNSTTDNNGTSDTNETTVVDSSPFSVRDGKIYLTIQEDDTNPSWCFATELNISRSSLTVENNTSNILFLDSDLYGEYEMEFEGARSDGGDIVGSWGEGGAEANCTSDEVFISSFHGRYFLKPGKKMKFVFKAEEGYKIGNMKFEISKHQFFFSGSDTIVKDTAVDFEQPSKKYLLYSPDGKPRHFLVNSSVDTYLVVYDTNGKRLSRIDNDNYNRWSEEGEIDFEGNDYVIVEVKSYAGIGKADITFGGTLERKVDLQILAQDDYMLKLGEIGKFLHFRVRVNQDDALKKVRVKVNGTAGIPFHDYYITNDIGEKIEIGSRYAGDGVIEFELENYQLTKNRYISFEIYCQPVTRDEIDGLETQIELKELEFESGEVESYNSAVGPIITYFK